MPVAQRRDALSLLLRVGSRTVRIKPVAIDHTTLNAGASLEMESGAPRVRRGVEPVTTRSLLERRRRLRPRRRTVHLPVERLRSVAQGESQGSRGAPPAPPAPQRLARCLCLPLSPPPPLPAASQVALAIKDDERGGRAKLTACDQGACAARRGARQHSLVRAAGRCLCQAPRRPPFGRRSAGRGRWRRRHRTTRRPEAPRERSSWCTRSREIDASGAPGSVRVYGCTGLL